MRHDVALDDVSTEVLVDVRGYMACVGVFWTLLWGRNVTVCGDSYRIVRRIGEGG